MAPEPLAPVAMSRSANVTTDPVTGVVSLGRLDADEFERPDGQGSYRTFADGSVVATEGAPWLGSMAGRALNAPMVSGTACAGGYWLAGADGGVFTFGELDFYGSMANSPLNEPVVAVIATPSCKGYWLLAADGGVFAFGDAPFLGSLAAQRRRDVFGFLFYGGYYALVLESGSVVRIEGDPPTN
jgi:hypothetical protein